MGAISTVGIEDVACVCTHQCGSSAPQASCTEDASPQGLAMRVAAQRGQEREAHLLLVEGSLEEALAEARDLPARRPHVHRHLQARRNRCPATEHRKRDRDAVHLIADVGARGREGVDELHLGWFLCVQARQLGCACIGVFTESHVTGGNVHTALVRD